MANRVCCGHEATATLFYHYTQAICAVSKKSNIELADDRAAWSEATAACGKSSGTRWKILNRMDVKLRSNDLIFQLQFIPEFYPETAAAD